MLIKMKSNEITKERLEFILAYLELKDYESRDEGFIPTVRFLIEKIQKELKQTDLAIMWETIKEAEAYYEAEINSNSNNLNPEFEKAKDAWLEENADSIKECYEENHPVVKDDEIGRDETYN